MSQKYSKYSRKGAFLTYINSKVEMTKRNIITEPIAECFGIHRKSVTNKLKGVIKQYLGSDEARKSFFPIVKLKNFSKRM